AGFKVTDITLYKGEIAPLLCTDCLLDFIKIVLVARGEVIKTHHLLTHQQQRLKQIRPNEAGATRHQPYLGFCLQTCRNFLISSVHINPCHSTKYQSIRAPYRRKSDSLEDNTYLRSY